MLSGDPSDFYLRRVDGIAQAFEGAANMLYTDYNNSAQLARIKIQQQELRFAQFLQTVSPWEMPFISCIKVNKLNFRVHLANLKQI